MINGLDLFTGIGGMSIALSEWVRPIAYCEIDPYCQGILLSKMDRGDIHNAPIWDDIRTLQSKDIRGAVDILYGGSPCQGFSIAGLGKGLEDERSGLLFEMLRVAKEIRPSYIFFENVPAITNKGGLAIVNEITEMGYDCRWCVISAASIGTTHKRERWFLLAHSNSESKYGLPSGEKERQPIVKLRSEYEKFKSFPENESALLRMDDEIPFRMDRTRAIGNAVVPQQAKEAFKILMGLK